MRLLLVTVDATGHNQKPLNIVRVDAPRHTVPVLDVTTQIGKNTCNNIYIYSIVLGIVKIVLFQRPENPKPK